ncbi:MAG: esterase-like activity of phytase family protein [Bacteriovoracaceae bacterium]|nr:esterase-like activity of phytase family protein [Bacteriovoracaceae bacterium]
MKFIGLCLFIATLCVNNIGATTLNFLSDFTIHTGEEILGSEIGGISAITYLEKQKLFMALSDDRGGRGDKITSAPRVFYFQLGLEDGKFDPISFSPLLLQKDHTFPAMMLDPEGLAVTKSGNVLISSEGYGAIVSPMILEFNRDLHFTRRYQLPDFLISMEAKQIAKRGVQNNMALESLTITPNQAHLITATEYSLRQDQSHVKKLGHDLSRIIVYKKSKNGFRPYRQALYPLGGGRGLVELLAINDNSLLSLERGWNPKTKKNDIRVFKTNFSKTTKLGKKKIHILRKKLVLNLDKVIPMLSKANQRLDNMEAMCLGPRLKNGNHTLIIASDNNFSDKQRTLFLIFELVP